MKKILFIFLLAMNEALILSAHSQGTVFYSSIEPASGGNVIFGRDGWIGQGFYTGTNTSVTYALNSIQLRMNAPSGDPIGFRVSIYNGMSATDYLPGSELAVLIGSTPTTVGVYDYSATGITLLPATIYFVVLTSLTPVSEAFYSASAATTPSSWTSLGGWLSIYEPVSNDGITWRRGPPHPTLQFAIDATSIPEPSSFLLCCGGLIVGALLFRKRNVS